MWRLSALILLGIQMGCTTNANEQMSPEMRSFYEQLSPQAKKQFMELDEAHRNAAVSATHVVCSGSNACGGNYYNDAVQEQYRKQKQGK